MHVSVSYDLWGTYGKNDLKLFGDSSPSSLALVTKTNTESIFKLQKHKQKQKEL